MLRSGRWIHLISGMLVGILFFSCQKKNSSRPYNILFIAVDDLRPELGCYGKPYVHSPNIDALAGTGTRFQRAYCSVSWCSPSRTSLMTGLRPTATGVLDLETHFRSTIPDAVTLPQFFKQQGYTALGFGKLFHNSQALQDSLSWSQPCWLPPVEQPILAYATPRNQQLAGTHEHNKASATEAATVPDTAYPDGMVTEQAIQALRQMEKNESPFFLGIGFYKPHLPFTAPQQYWDFYEADDLPLSAIQRLPQNASPYIFREWSEPGSYQDITTAEPYADSLARHLKHGYLACVSFVDAQVGRLLAELEQLGLREETIVVLWGNHGWKLGEYGRWSKHSTMEVDTRIPLIISVPGRSPSVLENIVETIDIYPTLVQLAGFSPPAQIQGEHLFAKKDSFALAQIPRDTVTGFSVRTPRYRYTEWRSNSQPSKVVFTELYDHQTDSLETVNIAHDSTLTVTNQLKSLLEN